MPIYPFGAALLSAPQKFEFNSVQFRVQLCESFGVKLIAETLSDNSAAEVDAAATPTPGSPSRPTPVPTSHIVLRLFALIVDSKLNAYRSVN